MLVLTAAEASAVAGNTAMGHALQPVLITNGSYILPERVRRDPAHASKSAALNLLPRRVVRWFETSLGGSGDVPDLGLDGALDPLPYAVADGCTSPFYSASYPSGLYVPQTNCTWIAWEAWDGLTRTAKWRVYNHSTRSWGLAYVCGTHTLTNDDHGCPALCRDTQGYMHVFYGAHASNLYRSVSLAPDDPSGYQEDGFFTTPFTYPHPILVGADIYLVVRDDADVNRRCGAFVKTTSVINGITTWSPKKQIIDMGPDSRFYLARPYLLGGNIHMCFAHSTSADTIRKNVYYAILRVADGAILNFSGSTIVAPIGQPVPFATITSDYSLYLHGADPAQGGLPTFVRDVNGNTHVFFAIGSAENVHDLMYMMNNGLGWSDPIIIGTAADRYIVPSPLVYEDGRVGVYWIQRVQPGIARGGDLQYRELAINGVWGAQRILQLRNVFALDCVVSINQPHPNARLMFAEITGDATTESGVLRGFIYGDSGWLTS